MERHNRKRLLVGMLAVLVVGTAAGVWYSQRLPKRFAPVVEGQLYRSGEVTPAQLKRLQEEYGIQRVVCLLNPAADVTQRERAAAAELGIAWHNVGLTGDGASAATDREQILALLNEPNAPPTLVHCAAGANRTGLAVGLYRIHEQGWSYDEVLAEMRRFGFEDLPKHENLRQALKAAAAAADQAHAPAQPTSLPASPAGASSAP